MILADTSIWIDHFRKGDAALTRLLDQGEVWIHPFIVGEIALGSLQPRADILRALRQLPAIAAAHPNEVSALHRAAQALRRRDRLYRRSSAGSRRPHTRHAALDAGQASSGSGSATLLHGLAAIVSAS